VYKEVPVIRAQVILEDWQHRWLAEEAQREAVSMSALLRGLLTEAIARRGTSEVADDPLWGVIGLGTGPDDGVSSENLDGFLYGESPDRGGLRRTGEDDQPPY
jgi:hypothetical protein